MQTNTLLLIILPVISAVISSYFTTFYFANKLKKNEAIQKFKEEKYSNLILHLQGFIGETANRETKRKFFEEQYKSWLYSSDEVVIAINGLITLAKEEEGKAPNIEKGRQAIGNVILSMRKDLLGTTSLSHRDFEYTDVIERKR